MVRSVKALLIVAVAAALVAAAGTEGRAAPAGPACTSVKVGGKRVCLTTGAKCSAKYAGAYKAHGFQCRKGRLAKIAKAKAIGTVASSVALPESASSLAAGEGVVWVAGLGGDVFRIDPATNAVTATVQGAPGQEFPHWIAAGGGALWISNFTDATVWRVDAATGTHTATIHVSPAPEGIAVTADGVWVATHHGDPTGSLTRIDPATNGVSARVAAGLTQDCCGPQGVAATDSTVWSTVPNLNAIVRVDTASGTVSATIPANPACGPVAAAADAVWAVSSCDVGNVYRVDPATNKLVATIKVSGIATDVAIGQGAIWVLTHTLDPSSGAGALVRIDPATNRIVGTMAVADAAGVAVVGGDVYVGSGHKVLHIRPAA
jgi:glutamine cyclotransferase